MIGDCGTLAWFNATMIQKVPVHSDAAPIHLPSCYFMITQLPCAGYAAQKVRGHSGVAKGESVAWGQRQCKTLLLLLL